MFVRAVCQSVRACERARACVCVCVHKSTADVQESGYIHGVLVAVSVCLSVCLCVCVCVCVCVRVLAANCGCVGVERREGGRGDWIQPVGWLLCNQHTMVCWLQVS